MRKSSKQLTRTKHSANAADDRAPVEKYFSRLPEPAKTTLQTVRAAILSACPKGIIETISYGIPTFKHNGGGVCAIAAFKNHCSLFPMSGFVLDKFQTELSKFEVSKGTVRFPSDKPLPASLIKKIIKSRLTQMSEKQSARKHKPKTSA